MSAMKCATCFKSVSSSDHEDVLHALGRVPRKTFDQVEKILGLSSRQTSDFLDESGNAVTCGLCYARALTKVQPDR